jgi:hypothetical protein
VPVRRDVREQVVFDLERQVAAHDVEQLAAGQVRRTEQLPEVPLAA